MRPLLVVSRFVPPTPGAAAEAAAAVGVQRDREPHSASIRSAPWSSGRSSKASKVTLCATPTEPTASVGCASMQGSSMVVASTLRRCSRPRFACRRATLLSPLRVCPCPWPQVGAIAGDRMRCAVSPVVGCNLQLPPARVRTPVAHVA